MSRLWSLDDFIFESYLMRGSHGRLYKVRDKKTNDTYALKIINIEAIKPIDYENEIRICSIVDHRNIVKFQGWFVAERPPDHLVEHLIIQSESCAGSLDRTEKLNCENSLQAYLIFEYAIYGDLFDWVHEYIENNKIGPPESTVLSIGRQLALAIEHCHSKGIIHRDIKIENILVTDVIDGVPRIKLCDFSLATTEKNSNQRCGTAVNLAHEIVLKKTYDKQIDLWSLGVVLYEISTGECMFRYDSDILHGLDWDIDHHSKLESNRLRQIIDILLNKDPTKRTLRVKEKIGNQSTSTPI
jgi:serine/threonine protein kinase